MSCLYGITCVLNHPGFVILRHVYARECTICIRDGSMISKRHAWKLRDLWNRLSFFFDKIITVWLWLIDLYLWYCFDRLHYIWFWHYFYLRLLLERLSSISRNLKMRSLSLIYWDIIKFRNLFYVNVLCLRSLIFFNFIYLCSINYLQIFRTIVELPREIFKNTLVFS